MKSELNTCAETSGATAGRETDGSVGPAASVGIHTAAAAVMLRGGDGEPYSERCCFRWVQRRRGLLMIREEIDLCYKSVI